MEDKVIQHSRTKFSPYKRSSIVGFCGIAIGLIAFLFNYYMVPTSMPAYEVFVAPAMFALSFFSEETSFTHKMIIFMFGQYIGYFCLAVCYIFFLKFIK